MKDVYLIGGLGADKRVFDFVDLSGYRVTFVEWVAPLDGESLPRYAGRLLEQVKSNRPVLIGVSFGGMVAVEMAMQKEIEMVILISSARMRFDFPSYLRLSGKLRLHKLIPTDLLKSSGKLTNWFFGTETESDRGLLKAIINDTDPQFLRWAIDNIVSWQNEALLSNVTTIHGTSDRILPSRSADYRIAGGGHFMVVNRGREIGALIKRILEGHMVY